ncbi:heavy metal-responsive transcriptional regulator [Cryobacterium sp. PH29-G1]|uniref:heavy metal-responsive transcriptional regulator n=1 Tax=Cryobacterium sp. PH29-G1 TaxID=3046211 RepID=UPI0024BAD36D|nr:heavy metal-responsive transcriptional regulator [Cryobacterium sp. PH29-G1]MDJ0348409.1 heavy metal-responsive transcriptional regulator [Cryobacterium sp. PH29-G1]
MRIGETAEAAGMTAKTLRFYEDRGLLPAAERAANGYREYGQDSLSRLDFIRRARGAGLTLAHIQDILKVRDSGDAPCTHVRELLAERLAELDTRIIEMTALRATVAGLHQSVSAADPARCEPDEICSYL